MPDGIILNDISTLGGVAGAIKHDGNRSYIYCYVAAASALGKPYVLTYDGDEATNPKTAAPATSAVYQLIVFPTKLQGADAGFMWCQFKGDAYVLVDGTSSVAKDDHLEVITTGVALILDGSTGSTIKTVGSVGIAQEAQATAAPTLTYVYLFGEKVNVAGS
jgi:hypothetical protein